MSPSQSTHFNSWIARISLLLSLVLVIPASDAQAQPVEVQAQGQMMTLDQALDIAVHSNPAFLASQAKLGVAEAEVITAGARVNPSIVSDNGIAEKTYRLGIQQTIQLGGKRGHRILLARAQRDVVAAEINTSLLDLRSEVRRSYTRLYNAQQRQATFEEILRIDERLLDVAKKREQAGDIPDIDVLQAELAVVRAKNDTQTAFGEVVQARNNLNILLNQALSTSLQLAPPTLVSKSSLPPTGSAVESVPLHGNASLAQADLEALVREALNRRPELQQNRLNLTVTQRQLSLARTNIIPDLTVAVGPDLVADSATKELNAFIIGNVELPLFNRQQGPIQEALARQTQLQREQAALRNRILLEVTNAYSSFALNQDRVSRYELDILPTAKTLVDKSRRSFEVGKSNILFAINAQQAYQQSQIDYLQAVQDYENAISDLERAVGTGL